ncbi:phage tail sheath subtilisin-like domain-containing protein [Megasphaera massiliensis]|uniref:phage tail sheath subtilisin-like domain-containing protein n=1 Tax=Megasphaera massiliensis TaxID=1232428 RepID=UPI000412D4F6|nr:phage tail sheath subtilisin-like domain-containing protein [Megasphaera massiliensis]DAF84481.1 MAG TPA: tail protein [Caudoviricetes sp.]
MAKLGMPSVNIAFQEAGSEAVVRSQRGIAVLILEEDAATITKLSAPRTIGDEKLEALTNPFTVYTTDDIPPELSEDNKDYIVKTLKGYVTTPYRVRVMLQAKGGEGDNTAGKFDESLKKIMPERWDYLAIPTIEEAQKEKIATWIKTNRENKYKKVKVVLPQHAADYEGVINFSNEFVETSQKRYTGAEYTARIAGLICGTPMTISATYAPLPEVIDCDKHDLDENDEKVNNGEFFIWFDGDKYKMSRAMNSLVTTTQGKLEAYQTIKSVDIADMMYDDIKKTAEDSYIGKYTNDYDNKCLLITAITGYFKELEDGRLLLRGGSTVDIDVEAVKTWLLKNGKKTKDELANMSDLEIKKADTKKHVFLKATVTILDAMEDIDLNVTI